MRARWILASAIVIASCAIGRPAPAPAGVVTVFENRATHRGRTLDIHYQVIPSERQPAHEALFMFAGGPGQATIATYGTGTWAGPVLASMDIVLVDQRGSGRSHALNCEVRAAADPAGTFGQMYPPEWVRRCRDTLSADADLTQYTTDLAVEDVEDIRAASRYDRISLYGGSYGTRMAQAYMRRYPARVKAAVIDGVVPFDNKLPLTYAASAQLALDRVFAACAAASSCREAHPSLPDDFQKLLRRFDTGPVRTTVSLPDHTSVPVAMSRGDFGYAVRGMLYNPNASRTLPDLIGGAVTSGDLREFAQSYWQRQVAFSHDFADGLHLSVLCAEDVQFVSDVDVTMATANTFLGRYVIDEYRRACALWPRGTVASDFHAPVSVRVPTLLVSGQFDPVTPPEFAEGIARSLPLARLVTAPQGAHVSAGGCPRAAVLHVLIDGTLDGLPDVCQER